MFGLTKKRIALFSVILTGLIAAGIVASGALVLLDGILGINELTHDMEKGDGFLFFFILFILLFSMSFISIALNSLRMADSLEKIAEKTETYEVNSNSKTETQKSNID